MKCKVLALLGDVRPGKKNPAAAGVNACLQYADGTAGNHYLYCENPAKVAAIRPGTELELKLRYEEFVSLPAGA